MAHHQVAKASQGQFSIRSQAPSHCFIPAENLRSCDRSPPTLHPPPTFIQRSDSQASLPARLRTHHPVASNSATGASASVQLRLLGSTPASFITQVHHKQSGAPQCVGPTDTLHGARASSLPQRAIQEVVSFPTRMICVASCLRLMKQAWAALREFAGQFRVSWVIARRSVRIRSTGSKERCAQPRHGPPSRMTEAMQENLRVWLSGQPDLTDNELRERLAPSGLIVSKCYVGKVPRKMGMRSPSSRTRATPQHQTAARSQREATQRI